MNFLFNLNSEFEDEDDSKFRNLGLNVLRRALLATPGNCKQLPSSAKIFGLRQLTFCRSRVKRDDFATS